MRKTFELLILLLGLLALGGPGLTEGSVLVEHVQVTVGSGTWCDVGSVTGACSTAVHPWDLGSGILLQDGESLVLTQGKAFDFDTSDTCSAAGGGCSAPQVTVNGLTFLDAKKILAGQGARVVDPVTLANNEAADWSQIGQTTLFSLAVGYADTEHTNPCADANHTCLPDNPWTNATFFLGAGGPTVDGTSCGVNCFDAGALLITAVKTPGAATLILFGLGMVGALGLRRRLL